MPSSGKTLRLGLNAFVGTDKPKMDDFNYDNTRLDEVVGTHLQDGQRHLSDADRILLGSARVIAGSYVGNGTGVRSVTLEREPAVGVLIANDQSLWAANPSSHGQTIVMGGIFAPNACTAGITLSGRTLQVQDHGAISVGEYFYNLNVDGVTYHYFYLPKLE